MAGDQSPQAPDRPDTRSAQRHALRAMRRELDVLRAEREVLVGFLKTFRLPAMQDELTIRFSKLGFPGCGRDPD
jgi:hypothetical protein